MSKMKVGLGMYPGLLTPENYRFAVQAGATHVVAHLPGFSHREGRGLPPEKMWTYEELDELKQGMNAEGLDFYAIENFEVIHWYDVLLDGPRRDEQIEGLKELLRTMGAVGIDTIGYNFSLANVWGRIMSDKPRGGATASAFSQDQAPPDTEIPNGTVWSTEYDPQAPEGTVGIVTEEMIWERFERFLKDLVPVAEEANVRLAMHPADPPLSTLRGTYRMVHKPEQYQRLLDLVPSRCNVAEFCQGTIAEMDGDMDVYEAIAKYTAQGKISYVHFRNVVGSVPEYYETFIDDGDVDMVKALRLYHENGFDGVLIPDHTPQMACDAPWHAGMAYALGWMRAVIGMIEAE
ncbi:MAG TPA: mannonate dehydratase [Candidatus Latescibacteria bacterium]|jgi:mannonate dehydratase|nr:mannonate dehydratase [Candidatus Latescibacterota bacterium]